jgi:segregation and condensation protein B
VDARALRHRVEALVFAAAQPLTSQRIAAALSVDAAAVKDALAELTEAWSGREGAVDLVEIAGGYRFMTRPAFHDDVASLRARHGPERLSPAALETLAVVAYRQPITRADVEAVRGVAVGPLLRLLLDRDLIRIAGRSPEPGHPLLYATTRRFLDHFGLKSLKALPDLEDLLESP